MDGGIFKRSHAALRKALQSGRQLTRNELRPALQKAGIETEVEFRVGYLLMEAELEGIA